MRTELPPTIGYQSLIVAFDSAENDCVKNCRSSSYSAVAKFAADILLRTHRITPQLALLTHFLAPQCSHRLRAPLRSLVRALVHLGSWEKVIFDFPVSVCFEL